MLVCLCCKAPSVASAGTGWGEVCGDCIAARIELELTHGLPVRIRRPMRRAGDLLDLATTAEPVAIPLKRQSAG